MTRRAPLKIGADWVLLVTPVQSLISTQNVNGTSTPWELRLSNIQCTMTKATFSITGAIWAEDSSQLVYRKLNFFGHRNNWLWLWYRCPLYCPSQSDRLQYASSS
jgi:hypothetical protein